MAFLMFVCPEEERFLSAELIRMSIWTTSRDGASGRTEQGRPDISSRKEDIVRNSEGSVDVYFGPKAPAGKERNWVQTVPGKGWFAYFRFYGPTQPFFDKSWVLPDFEEVR